MTARNFITVDGINIVSEVSKISEGFWVTIACLGSTGLFIDNDEWDAFVKLVNETDKAVKELK